MKKIFSIFLAISVLAGLSVGVTSCFYDQPELVESLELGGCLTPTSTSLTVSTVTGDDVTFTWASSKGATHYVLEIYEITDRTTPVDEVFDGSPEYSRTVAAVEGSSVSHTEKLPAGNLYRARVKAQQLDENGNPVIEDSKWAVFTNVAEPSLIRDAVPTFKVTDRTSTSITVAWTIEQDDTEGLDHIRVYAGTSTDFKEVKVEKSATSYEITELTPSVKYTLAAHYQSAKRGEVTAWTCPDTQGTTPVNTSEALIQALADGAPIIVVAYSETPYNLYTGSGDAKVPATIGVTADKTDFAIYGEGKADGEMPTVNGGFTLPNGLTSIHLEGINFNGEGYAHDHVLTFAKGFATPTVKDISMLNCTVTGYKKGIFYDNEYDTDNVVTIQNLSFNNIYVSDIEGSGGNGFDIRRRVIVNNYTVTESTFTNGFRTFFRVDAYPKEGPSVAKVDNLVFTNNTLNSLCAMDDGNNQGLFHVQAPVTAFTFTNNLIMNVNGHETRSRLFSGSHSATPTLIKDNYFYNPGKGFWSNNVGVTAETTGITVLADDPCVDSPRNILNVTNSAVLGAKAGDPRWFETYVPAPTPELEPVEYGYKWDLTDQMTFYETVDASTVRGNTEFFIGSDPINVTDKGFEFTGAASLAYGGVPTSSAIAFLVNAPGSIYASTLVSGSNYGGHIAVAVGPTSGISAAVVGSLYAGAEDAKVVFEDITEPQIIYLYAGGPIVLSALEWSADVSTGITNIDAPVVTATPGEAKLSISWPAVENAASYIISFGTKAPVAEYGETEYTISTTSTSYSWENFPSGTYTVNVQALTADETRYYNSDIAGTSVTVTAPATMSPLTSGAITQEDMKFLCAVTESNVINGTNIYYKGFQFTGIGKVKSAFKMSDKHGAAFYNTGGASSYDADKPGHTIRFVAGGAGKLTYVVTSNGSDNRTHLVSINSAGDTQEAGVTKPQPETITTDWTDHTYTRDLTTSAGDVVDLYSTKSVNYISVTWEPSSSLPADEAGVAPVYEETTWGADVWKALDAKAKELTLITAGNTNFEIKGDAPYFVYNNFMVYFGGNLKTDVDCTYIQPNGSSFSSKDSAQEVTAYYRRLLRFRVGGNGTLKVTARGTGSGQSGRTMYIVVGGSTTTVGTGTFHSDAWDAGANASFTEHSWDITASNGDAVTIAITDGLRIQSVTWTPAE